MQEDSQKIKIIQDQFRNKLLILQKTKDSLLKLFRNKLEEKKIDQIKDSLIINSDSNIR